MAPFRIIEHQIPCQHIREFPGATLDSREDVLHLAVKQYIPIDNPNPRPGDVTIIGGHANGFPKELYEPLWEDIITRARKSGMRIRSIWIADVAQQGESGVLNENMLGNDPHWNDHPRDLLHMINLKRDEMPLPIVGIGHSMGGNHLVNLAYMHPSLFTSLVLIDPVIQAHFTTPPGAGPSAVRLSTFRRETWPSKEVAAQAFRKSKFYQTWDTRVLDKWIEYGLREVPTALFPETPDGPRPVTLKTTKHQELFTFARPNYQFYGVDGKPINRTTHPDMNVDAPIIGPFYRSEPINAFERLAELRPSVLYIFGETSEMSTPAARMEKLRRTGTGNGGSGGAKAGRVKEVVLNTGHLVAMEATSDTADAATEWLNSEVGRWKEETEQFRKQWNAKSRKERQMIDELWPEKTGGPLRPPAKSSKL